MMPALSTHGLKVSYGGNQAVRDVEFEVAAGSLVGIVGANGAGKSTVVNALAGWSRGQPVVSGRVLLDGRDISSLPAHRRARAGLLLVPEGKGMFNALTVEENLQVVRPPPQAGGRHAFTLDEVYAVFPRLFERCTHKGNALSGGERQMLSIGRALRAAPRVLLLDEPSVGLAPRLVLDMLLRLRQLVDQGLSLVLVEQNVRAALEVVDELVLLERGSAIARGSAEEMRNDPRIVAAYLGSLSA